MRDVGGGAGVADYRILTWRAGRRRDRKWRARGGRAQALEIGELQRHRCAVRGYSAALLQPVIWHFMMADFADTADIHTDRCAAV